MYSYMIGQVTNQESNSIILEVNCIGYLIYVSNPFVFETDKSIKIFLYQVVREDENSLYGFKTSEEKELFLKLISVKGIGPKMALPLLATGSVSGIKDAIERENVLYLKKFPKIGDKAAKQMILDLKGKLGVTVSSDNSANELVSVLKGLGYKEREIKDILPKVDSSLRLEEQIKEALKLFLK